MKLSELKRWAEDLFARGHSDPEVVIIVSERSVHPTAGAPERPIPPPASVGIYSSAHFGGDSGEGRIYLRPDEPLVRKPKKRRPQDDHGAPTQ